MMKEWGDPLFCLLIRIKRKSRPLGRERVKRMSPAPKKKGNVAQRVWELSEPLAKELNLSLWDVQFVKEGADWFLRVFIDKEGGVSIDDCVDMTHALSPVLDKEDPIPQEYMLEVSSPGLERKLTRPEHFAAFVGRPPPGERPAGADRHSAAGRGRRPAGAAAGRGNQRHVGEEGMLLGPLCGRGL